MNIMSMGYATPRLLGHKIVTTVLKFRDSALSNSDRLNSPYNMFQ